MSELLESGLFLVFMPRRLREGSNRCIQYSGTDSSVGRAWPAGAKKRSSGN